MQARAAMEAVRPSASRASPLGAGLPSATALGTGFEVLDGFLGGFARGSVTALDGSTPLLWDVLLGALCEAARDGSVVAVDGGNSLDPYLLAGYARRAGLAPRKALGALRVARAFTAHQMSALLDETLPGEVLDHRPGLVAVSCLPELYLDEDVPWPEANALLDRALGQLRDLARGHGCAVLATNVGATKLASRPRLRDAFYAAERVVRILRWGEGSQLEDLPAGRALRLEAAPRAQRTLANFHEAQRPLLSLAPAQLMVKGVA